ncbi:MAG: glycosyltransferase [Ignavibacteriales bacterium]
MKVVILHQTITNHDAIGNDIEHMYDILNKKHECFVYCNYLFNDKLINIDNEKLSKIISDENNLIIYHHSVFWEEGEKILENARAKIIFKYHNITPACFFKEYNEHAFQQCSHGREQTVRFAENFKKALWMGDSKYNLQEINCSNNKVVVPPFNNIERWDSVKPDEAILKSLIENKNINILFVGRVAPNKGHKYLFQIIKDYTENYGSNICLNIIGKMDGGLKPYNDELNLIIEYCGLTEKIKFIGEITESILISYYLGSDFFISCSEHEGFCVPLIESQYLNLPVIAKKTSAIEETLGINQLAFFDDVIDYTAAIKVLTENNEYREFIIQNGLNNYENRFSNSMISNSFIKEIEKFTGEKI